MRIITVNGGLGNQTFQYIFARWLEETTGERVFCNDAEFSLTQKRLSAELKRKDDPDFKDTSYHNGYEMEYVFPNLRKPLRLSEYFEPDVWQYIMMKMRDMNSYGDAIAKIIYETGIDLTLVSEPFNEAWEIACKTYPGKKFITPVNSFNSDMARIPGDVYYRGWWFNEGYFNAYREKFLEEFAFRPITDERNKEYEREIRGCFSVGVHVRCDHGGVSDGNVLDTLVPLEVYNRTITDLKKKIPGDAKFFLFSNRMNWCRENLTNMGLNDKEVVFVEGNFDFKNNYIDVQLMGMTKVLVCAGDSTFSFLACVLNQDPDFYSLLDRRVSTQDLAVMNDPKKLKAAMAAGDDPKKLMAAFTGQALPQTGSNRAMRRKSKRKRG